MSRPFRLLLFALVLVASAGWSAPPSPWLRIGYGNLIDRRKLSHSGEPVAVLVDRLAAHPNDALARRLLDPILEPYAFVLPDALDALAPPHDPPYVEIGGLYEAGGEEPAWVELCRARRFLIESDGQGRLRAFLPSPSLERLPEDDSLPAADAAKAAEEAWRAAWPVVRHIAAAERRRLERARGGPAPALDVEVRAYRHLASRSAFVVGEAAWSARIEATGPPEGARPLDLAALRSILERGAVIEGARLDPSGRIRWFTSDGEAKPQILGRAPTLADLAVAYRAVAHGGFGEPYMSLDRAAAPHVAEVNYGGRLRDTALGMVSLLSDVRFKTFSVGIDLLGAGDARAPTATAIPGFKTHLERFAADPSAGTVLNQQTRFWFYPDDVDLTLSAEGDVLAFRRARMAAASERVQESAARTEDPAWTRDTVSFLNTRHDDITRVFPEVASLDETVRYLAIFTWLEAARGRGLNVPDLDVLLALPLPALPTPRRFPQLLSYDVLPPPGAAGSVDVYDRTGVGAALDRLEPTAGKPLPAPRRLQRALAQLDKRVPDQAALAQELEPLLSSTDTTALDLAAYRAERLLMHARVLATLREPARGKVEARRKEAPGTRVFSVGIGGVDLGMNAVFERASSKGSKLSLGAQAASATRDPAPPAAERGAAGAPAPAADPPGLPGPELPDHGLGPAKDRAVTVLEEGRGRIEARARPGTLVRKGTWKIEGGRSVAWEEARYGVEGTEVKTRRRISEPDLASPAFERVEDGRFLAYRFARDGQSLRAELALKTLPDRAFAEGPPPVADPAAVSDGLAILDLVEASSAAAEATPVEPTSVRVRVRAASAREVSASLPRGLLQRLVLGREVDVVPERPLAAFTPASQVLGTGKTMMIAQTRDESQPPWAGMRAPRPGEEDAARLARALSVWWASDPGSAGAVAIVGTSPASAARWASAPKLGATAEPVVLVSPDASGMLGRALRAIATDPAMKGRYLCVVATGGGVRGDLPASLLAEGNLAGIGVAAEGPTGTAGAVERAAAWSKACREPAASGRRPEDIPGPFTWYY